MHLIGKKVRLRAIEPRDLDRLNEWANDPDIQYGLGGWHFPTSSSDQARWYDGLSATSLNQRFAIEADTHGLIGTANLVDIDWKNRNAFHGLMLGHPGIRGKGFGLDTVMTIMRFAFDELNLNRLDGSMIEYNESSLRLYLGKCGWKEEGRQRAWYFRKGRFWDRVMVGITREDHSLLLADTRYWD